MWRDRLLDRCCSSSRPFLGGDEAVGWFAHLGGFVAGAVLIPVLRRRYDPVLARVAGAETRAG